MTADTPGHGGNSGDPSAINMHSVVHNSELARVIPTKDSLLADLAATRAADEKAREQRLPWSAP